MREHRDARAAQAVKSTDQNVDGSEALEQAERVVAALPRPMAVMYSVSRATLFTAVLFAVAWWVQWFSPWWTLLVLPVAFCLNLLRELGGQDQPSPEVRRGQGLCP